MTNGGHDTDFLQRLILEFKQFFSAVCMVTMGMDKLSAPAFHALNEPPEACLRNVLKFSNEGLFQLLDGLRKVLHSPNASSKNVPKFLYRVQMW